MSPRLRQLLFRIRHCPRCRKNIHEQGALRYTICAFHKKWSLCDLYREKVTIGEVLWMFK